MHECAQPDSARLIVVLCCPLKSTGNQLVDHHKPTENRSSSGEELPAQVKATKLRLDLHFPYDLFGQAVIGVCLPRHFTKRLYLEQLSAVQCQQSKLDWLSGWQSQRLWNSATGRKASRLPVAGREVATPTTCQLVNRDGRQNAELPGLAHLYHLDLCRSLRWSWPVDNGCSAKLLGNLQAALTESFALVPERLRAKDALGAQPTSEGRA